jgi:Icc-related predicted phosphoesterase
MLIGHVSDIHGNLKSLLSTDVLPDLWLFTGDIFPNMTRGDAEVEVPFQNAWFAENAEAIVARLGNVPVLSVGGNHDFIDLATRLREHGVDAHTVTPTGVEILGIRFAGFREIPYIQGEWFGETHDFTEVIGHTFASDPQVLVTHAPPAGILDEDGYGIKALTTALAYRPHGIQAHFFGHCHGHGFVKCDGHGLIQRHGHGVVKWYGHCLIKHHGRNHGLQQFNRVSDT